MKSLATAHGVILLPAFLPDATRAVVRTLDSRDLEQAGIGALMVNAYHLADRPGTTLVQRVGGVHRFLGWTGPVASDSGGFQIHSLGRDGGAVQVSAKGLIYRRRAGGGKKILTPEKSIQQQLRLGADVLFCLDHCTHPEQPAELQRSSVRHTIDWARRSFEELARRRPEPGTRPRLFAVVQGGNDLELRRECAESLLEIGFDGYGFGGVPVGRDGRLLEMAAQVAQLLPGEAPKHALGVGSPENLVAAWRGGYRLFDCALPTRDARHGRLYLLRPGWQGALQGDFCDRLYVRDQRHRASPQPIDPSCDCLLCARYCAAWLQHLFAIGDSTGARLATIHNLRTYARLIAELRGGSAVR